LGLLGPTNSQGKVLQTWNSNSFATEADYNDWKSHIVDTNTASPPSLTDETDSWYQWDKDIYGLKVIDGGGVGYRAHKLYAKWNSSSSLSREYVLFEYPLNQPAPAGAEFNLSFKSYTGPAGQVSYSIYGPGPAIQFSDAPLLTFQSNNTFNLISTGNVPVSKGAKSIKIGAYITNMYDHACFLDDWVVTYGTGLPAQGPIVPKGSGSAPAAEAVKAMTERKLPPERYDIWFGKKDRLYLAGIWNLKKLPGTRENPADDMGTKEGFWKEDFNDYNWEPALVPWDIN